MKTILATLIFLIFSLNISAQSISKEQAIADIDYFDKVLREVHYSPFLYISESAYLKKMEEFKKNLSPSMNTKSFALQMGMLTSLLEDTHTAPVLLQPSFQQDYRKDVFMPLTFVTDKDFNVYTDGKLASDSIPAGAEIISVNEALIKDFFRNTTKLIGGVQAYRTEMAAKMLGYNLYLTGLQAPFHIKYLHKGKSYQKTITQGTKLRDLLSNAFPALIKKPYEFRIVNDKIGYIQLNTLEGNYEPYMKFFDSCFNVVKEKNIKTVAIDIRKNTGGNSINADLLLGYFNKKKYSLSGGKNWKVSQYYKNILIEQGDTANAYLKKENGSIWKLGNCEPAEPRYISKDFFFAGKVYLLTGPITFSSANMLADGLKKFKLATIIGEPTGENTNDFGETCNVVLPNSKIVIRITTSFDLGAGCGDTPNQTVVPDILIKTNYQQVIKGDDPLLQYLIDLYTTKTL